MNLNWATDLVPPWAITLWANDQNRLALVLGALGLFVAIALPGKNRKNDSVRTQNDSIIRRPTNTPLWRRLLWRIRPPVDLMRVDGLTIDRSRKPHAAWLGPTGAGKTSAVAAVRCDGRRVYLAATPDLSDPLVDATLRLGGFRWTAGVSTTPIDFLIGTPAEVAERLTEVFRSGGVGAWKRTAYLATAEVIRKIDAAGESRTFLLIGQRLKEATRQDRELKLACDGWVSRFLSVAEKFGTSAGPDGVDLANLLCRGVPILIDNDAFEHPGLTEDVVALALAEAKRCASLCPSGFRLIFEEAGQLGDRIELAAPFFRAGRRRKIAVDVITQAESDLAFHGSDALTSNIATRIYFNQAQRSLRKAAADWLDLDETTLAKIPDFSAYIVHDKIRRLVRFPKPPKHHARSLQDDPYTTPSGDPTDVRTIAGDLPTGIVLRLPPPRLEVQRLLDNINRTSHCHEWMGPFDNDGYGVTDWKGKRGARVHRVIYELVYGRIPTGPNGKPLDLDHLCRNRKCAKPEHLEPVTRSENVRRMHRVRGHATAAD